MSADSKNVPMIKMSNVKKSFGDKHVLRGVNLEVQKGESLVVIGGSGTGKSVLLKNIFHSSALEGLFKIILLNCKFQSFS